MKLASLERVFGTSRLKMVTGKYVEVYREAAVAGERRRYTKRFLATNEGDFREWTEREWRILARLVGHRVRHVPDVVQFDRGAAGGDALVQTYDAGVTVDHWATLLPVQRGGRAQRHIFQDCAHWWALARHLLLALHEIHPLRLVHLDLKADNICIPLAPADFDHAAREQRLFPAFENIALIDFAFSVVSGEALTSPLPIGWEQTYHYQSPRLLKALVAGQKGDLEPTRQLDWRCDMYSLAALLEALMPSAEALGGAARIRGWTDPLGLEARSLVLKIRQSHDHALGAQLPHLSLVAACEAQLETPELSASLRQGWTLVGGIGVDATAGDAMKPTAPLTRVTLIEPRSHFTSVTEVLPRPEHHGAETAADVQGRLVDDAPIGATASPDGPDAPATDILGPVPPSAPRSSGASLPPHPVPSSALDSTPVKPKSVGLPAASARGEASRKRPVAVYLLPVLVGVAAVAGWMAAHDPGSAVGDQRAASPSSARVEVANSTGTAATAKAPDMARTSASAVPPERAVVPPTVAAAPSLAKAEQRPRLPSAPVPPARDAPEAAQAPSPAAPEERFAQQTQPSPAGVVPRVVARAERRVARVLSIADRAQRSADDRLTVAAAATIGDGVFGQAGAGPAARAPVQARKLNAAAQKAFYRERSVVRAYELQRQAFNADPTDVEIAGNLAFYALKMDPPRAEESRALAIYALALSTRAQGPSRSEDWGNLAVASALSGRSGDARNAMLVLLAVSRDVNRSCHSALSSVASHGQAMRVPAEALLLRAQDRVDVAAAKQCRWPAEWRRR